ncbi:prepilin-type N-terminal cleavage/methylation domain-containing protein [Fictibacillus sp. 23RED33]|jgi:prepilin-type N-terminal cleavage/methylation domain-containing protein|uniref:PulJ/GspJ family protein n=1 Tax=Fictibacillus sp. 23RED33 TaxID=2745879 RepID=UPI0018CF620B|nr:prepilin-type N-terminal cleavage/methylation domain-containing protein [Fictibacillus sp. 23RED33]MBH0173839.1 prepilin-type N-terminal cleavage/methylation domain-containing protein [Fictibacillus sp. 23RED33]
MLNKVSNQNGLTLIESLLSVVLFSIIGTVIYFVLLSGINTEKKIYNETLLRDEADLVMAQIIDIIYTAPASKVKDASTGRQNVMVYEVNKNTIKTVGFIDNIPVINGQNISSKEFDFNGSSIAKVGKSVKIILNVKSNKNENAKPLTLQSQFGLLEE